MTHYFCSIVVGPIDVSNPAQIVGVTRTLLAANEREAMGCHKREVLRDRSPNTQVHSLWAMEVTL